MLQKALVATSWFIICFLVACSSRRGLFTAKKTPHEVYSDKIDDAGLRNTIMGNSWFMSAQRSLEQPVAITVPYEERGYFAADKPTASGFRFSLRRGEQVVIAISTVPVSGAQLFAELWQPGSNGEMKLLAAADTIAKQIQYEARENEVCILRLQPELLKGLEYNLRITTAPSLAFPVRASDKPRITSFWGADRDGGSRSHEGVDIFAKPRTPLLAAANGRITSVGENNLGGKVVFLRPDNKPYHLYYAHLDSQLVREGQRVLAGDVIGLMGNTGNARTTAAHLHFGIYAEGGAVDPLPFIDTDRKQPRPVAANTERLDDFMRTRSATSLYTTPSAKSVVVRKVEAGAIYRVLAATDDWYRVLLPGDSTAFIQAVNLTTASLKREKLSRQTRLLDEPLAGSAAILVLDAGTEVAVLGKQSGFSRVGYNNQQGWMLLQP